MEKKMAITPEFVRTVFAGLEQAHRAAFFGHDADDVDCIVTGSHPLAGRYRSKKDFVAHTFEKLSQVFLSGPQMPLEQLLAKDDEAVVERRGATAKSSFRFDNRYCRVVFFDANKIARVREYLDSATMTELLKENPIE
jgi:uncharacterized protein